MTQNQVAEQVESADVRAQDTGCYDLVWQHRQWDRDIGRGSYCIHAARISAGRRWDLDNLDVAIDRAQGLLHGASLNHYIEIIADYPRRIAATVTA